MPETLTHVQKTIKTAEKAKKENPQFYNMYWRSHHELLLKIQAELEKKNENI